MKRRSFLAALLGLPAVPAIAQAILLAPVEVPYIAPALEYAPIQLSSRYETYAALKREKELRIWTEMMTGMEDALFAEIEAELASEETP